MADVNQHFAKVSESHILRILGLVQENTKSAMKFDLKVYKRQKRLTDASLENRCNFLHVLDELFLRSSPHARLTFRISFRAHLAFTSVHLKYAKNYVTLQQFQDMSLAITDFLNLSKPDCQNTLHLTLAEMNTTGFISGRIKCYGPFWQYSSNF